MTRRPPEWDDWLAEGARLLAVPPLRRSELAARGPEDPKFGLGDFLLTVPAERVDNLAEALGQQPNQFRIYREVAELIAPARRVAASWTVHRDLRRDLDILRPGLTVRDAAALLGKQPIDSKAHRKLSVEVRADRVRAELRDPAVFELIDNQMQADKLARQERSRARRVQSALGLKAKELEDEVRRLREAQSPYEATVKAELELNRSSQLVEAIGATISDLPQPERLYAALKELRRVIDAVLPEPDDRTPQEPVLSPLIVQAEAWRV